MVFGWISVRISEWPSSVCFSWLSPPRRVHGKLRKQLQEKLPLYINNITVIMMPFWTKVKNHSGKWSGT